MKDVRAHRELILKWRLRRQCFASRICVCSVAHTCPLLKLKERGTTDLDRPSDLLSSGPSRS